jgi:hypothetical protein
MKKVNLSKLSFMSPLIISGSKLSVSVIMVIMIITSSVFMLVNPTQALAVTTTSNSNSIDTSNHHSDLQAMQTYLRPSLPVTPATAAPPVSSQGNDDFTTQAALSLTRAAQTNNIVASKSYYDISFRTATAGAIKTVTMDFPAGTAVGSALLVEATGIGPGTVSASAGEVLTYTVTNAVNVPANTIIRIQISNINNPPTPSASFTVSITTRNAANGVIDGPTPTSAYNMVQVGNAQIAPGAVTTTKIATGAVTSGDISSSFMRSKFFLDDAAGHAVGWNPDGTLNSFSITDPAITVPENAILVNVADFGADSGCNPLSTTPGAFFLDCLNPPLDGSSLHYIIFNLEPSG